MFLDSEVIILYEIEYYVEKDNSPVVEFLNKLNSKEQAKILRVIDLLQDFGLFLGPLILRNLKAHIINCGSFELSKVLMIFASSFSASPMVNSSFSMEFERQLIILP